MTGLNMFDKSMSLLGYTGSHGELAGKDELLTRGLAIINQIYSDLWFASRTDDFVSLNNMNDEINLSNRILHDVMPYGVAMYLAQAEDDGTQQQIFAGLYNQKRGSVKSPSKTITDSFPKVWY